MKTVFKQIGVLSAVALIASSCTKDPDSPGIEYMPDMYRSPSIEAYVDYGEFRNEEHPELKEKLTALAPPSNTIPYYGNAEKAAYNMPLPFKAPFGADKSHGLYGWEMYASVDEFNEALKGEIAEYKNPVPYTEENAKRGKELYMRMCSQCHGEKGNGQGIVGKKIGSVADFTGDSKATPEGTLFYYMTYGKGQMGAHGMIISREDRWNIVHQLRAFQDSNYPNGPEEEEKEDVDVAMDAGVVSDTVAVETPNDNL